MKALSKNLLTFVKAGIVAWAILSFSTSNGAKISDLFVCNQGGNCTLSVDTLNGLCKSATLGASGDALSCIPYALGSASTISASDLSNGYNSAGDFFDCASGFCLLKKDALNGICPADYLIYFDSAGNVSCAPANAGSLSVENCSGTSLNIGSHTYSIPSFSVSIDTSMQSPIPNGLTTYYQEFVCKNGAISASGSERFVGTLTTCSPLYEPDVGGTSCVPSASWVTGVFGQCSASCGGGTKYRTVVCQRNDGQLVDDSNCIGPKPALESSCNSQVCAGPVTFQTDLYNLPLEEIKYLFNPLLSEYAASWGNSQCSNDPNVIEVNDAASFNLHMNGKALLTNTIYRVANGRYKVTGTIGVSSCSAIVGESKGGVEFERSFQPSTMLSAGKNSVVYQLTVDGESLSATGYDDGQGDDIYAFTGNTCEMHTSGTGGSFNHIIVQDSSTMGLCIYTRSATFNDVTVRGSFVDGFNVSSASGNVLTNLETYRNGATGFKMTASPNNRITGMNTYKNNTSGIMLSTFSTHENIFTNIRSYSNRHNGLYLHIDSHDNSFNNLQSYNNTDGIYTVSSAYRNAINNALVYNNGYGGIALQSYGTGHILNNVQVFNNRGRGIDFFGSPGNILHDVWVYNNTSPGSFTQEGIITTVSGGSYYGLLKMFGNLVNSNPLAVGTGLGALGWSNGALSQTGSMNCSLHPDPDSLYSGSGCITKGTGVILPYPTTSFNFGTGLMNQVRPVISIGTGLHLYGTGGIDYDVAKKIGQF